MNLVGFEVAGTLGPRVSRLATDECANGAAIVACPPLSFALTAKGGRFDGESETFVPIAFSERSRDGSTAIEFEKNGITSAIKTGTQRQQGVMGSFGVRRLMPIECERCQGMTDHWTRYGILEDGREVELSDSARYRLIGNSVAVPNVEWIAKRIMGYQP